MNKTLILVVEDDTPVRNLITTTLKTHDYKYLAAPDGTSAILEASSHNPDIVLLDLGLPDIDGVEVIRKIRSWSNMPIIVISARTEDSDKIEALDAGADDYLTKPFSVEELLARLRATQRRLGLMKSESGQESPIFTNGELKIDYAAGCAYMQGEELHLTRSSSSSSASSPETSGRSSPTPTSPSRSGEAAGKTTSPPSASSWRPSARSSSAAITPSRTFRRTSASATAC